MIGRVQVSINLNEKTARVSRGCDEKYARKLLQDKLKTETLFKGGWTCYLTNRSKGIHSDGKAHAFIPHTSEFRDWEKTDDEYYIFELQNPFAIVADYIKTYKITAEEK